MAEALTIAVSGLNAAAQRVVNSASNLVNASSTGYRPTEVKEFSNSVGDHALGVRTETVPRDEQGVDIASEMVDLKMAEISYKANAAVVRIQTRTDKDLLDMLA